MKRRKRRREEKKNLCNYYDCCWKGWKIRLQHVNNRAVMYPREMSTYITWLFLSIWDFYAQLDTSRSVSGRQQQSNTVCNKIQ